MTEISLVFFGENANLFDLFFKIGNNYFNIINQIKNMGAQFKLTDQAFTQKRNENPNKNFVKKINEINRKGKATKLDKLQLQALYKNVKENEVNKIATVRKNELATLSQILGLKNDLMTVLRAIDKNQYNNSYEENYTDFKNPYDEDFSDFGIPNINESNEFLDDNIPSSYNTTNSNDEIWGLKPDFGYKAPKYDKNGNLLARTDLKKASEVEDGYSSIKELFTKLNSMTETQVEPLYKPIYNGEGLPTFIIVGDIHADEYNIDGKSEDNNIITNLGVDGNFLIEKDESSLPEINSIKILREKFDIKNIGLENIFNSSVAKYILNIIQYFSGMESYKIGNGLDKLKIDYIGLENINEMIEAQFILNKSIIFDFAEFKKLGVNLNTKAFTKKEFIDFYNSNKDYLKLFSLNDSDFLNIEKKDYHKLKIKIKNILESKINLEKKDLTKLYKFQKYIYNKQFSVEYVKTIIEEANDFSKKINNKNDLVSKKLELLNKINKIIIKARNKAGIENITEKMDKYKKMNVMVYGKAHIPDLIRQLKEKYDGKVNIYVAK